MSLKYSVVIPVYKAEKTLRRCVDSLLCRQREDVEIILVNDGSPDDSGEICEQYAAQYPQIRYYYKENGGVSTARNLGLQNASGTYITFVDSDDYVSEVFFAAFDAALRDYDWDYIQMSHWKTDGFSAKEVIRQPFRAGSRQELSYAVIDAICRKTINTPWAKAYKRSIIMENGLCFPEGASIAEDRAFNIAYSTHIDSYCVCDVPVYYVSTENQESLSRKRQDDLEAQFAITGAYAEKAIAKAPISEAEKEQYMAALHFGVCRGIYKTAKDLHRAHVPFFKRIRTIRARCREINAHCWSYPKTRYCRLISLPVRWKLAFVIDAMAWKLTH